MGGLFDTFRWTDLLDIFVVGLLIYLSVSTLRRSLAVRLLGVFSALFFTAILIRFSGLVTLRWLLDSLLGSAVIVTVIIFQSDIRRTLLTYGKERTLQPRESSEIAEVIETVCNAAGSLASRRIGALIVIERGMGLDAFIEVGTEIDAKVTSELLTSIFLPYSPIHDGAVIIRRGKLTYAGCFLPLTRNPTVGKNLGTRHRAAIGLTEQVDALVVVVSEETGGISIVLAGRITSGLDESLLRKSLKRHLGTLPRSEQDGNV